ncbi:MAG: bifunctional transaldolase/phosoglucose isomerase [Chloroflexota bacterium]
MTNLHTFAQLGQSVWLNYLRRAFLESGELADVLELGVCGITSTPALFAKAITHSSDYDQVLQRLSAAGVPVKKMYEALLIDDMQRAADRLHGAHEASDGLDGFVSMELDPAWMHDTVNMVAEAQRLLRAIDRVNVMIEVPATPAGIEAIRILTTDGVSLNATHIFSVDVYEQVAQAYIDGLEAYFQTHSVWRIAPSSVASFSLSRTDTAVDELLAAQGRFDLQGRTAIALAKIAYGRFQSVFTGPRWQKLVKHGGRPLRLKWTRTTPYQFHYTDTHYVEALIGPDTVITLSPVTLNAMREHGRIETTLFNWQERAQDHLATIADLGIDLDAITTHLQAASLAAYDRQFQTLIHSVSKKREQLESGWQRLDVRLGAYQPTVNETLSRLCTDRVVSRFWRHDRSLWKGIAPGVADRLGWLHVVEAMQENLDRLNTFAKTMHEEGFTQVLLVGSGGATSPGNMFSRIFGKGAALLSWQQYQPGLTLRVLDTTDPVMIRHQVNQLHLPQTLFIIADKAGHDRETRALFNYLYTRLRTVFGHDQAGKHFVAITDIGSPLAEVAYNYRFRDIFLDDPAISEPYGALSYLGLVPAALLGVNVAQILDQALAMQCNASSCNCPSAGDNLGAQLGVILATLAQAGRDKLTLVMSPAIAPFADWIEQLVATSTGKAGRGLVPVVHEPLGTPAVYGDDRLFVQMRLRGEDAADMAADAALAVLQAAGHPLVKIHLQEPAELGGCLFSWQMATAVAAHQLRLDPFAQPDIDETEQFTEQLLEAYQEQGHLPAGKAAPIATTSLEAFLATVKPGDYVALQAYVPATPETDAVLQSLRTHIRDEYHLATTVGYGPRYLHTTGQLQKGCRKCGHFIQLTTPLPADDVPIPDEPGKLDGSLTFGTLRLAQALADGQALLESGRHLLRFHVQGGMTTELAVLLN